MQATAMNVPMVLVPQIFLDEIMEKIESLQSFLSKKLEGNSDLEWIESDRARKIFGVCKKTWQTYRDRRVISFSQFGRKIYIHKNDLNNFMEEHKVKSRR
ncbi:hypothetical protein M2451_000821 [Dysgonomonas sp. PFB1-18]|uniref:helix-turn-helix domain-containing protein n=1 Tax=unclassified Dysgonomonas TaxID=2630389 RepID=UPI00247564D0|nr:MULTISPECIES: helix-turn-helix domain-containing protein [unclassified Dysgonomonas]MDH6308510.1 hypothetical protein [Dysgonomonas sp. PF1-14]MDH6338011.1 hypothetical protein [Dysgonomonas sp. PF1-16]MDH6379508.1 hypothetical protein [Dysgonomonas sp. PFB1-18]MDH6396839.1 hypothetical protein [Dysgonomonas sp. PF1-23]